MKTTARYVLAGGSNDMTHRTNRATDDGVPRNSVGRYKAGSSAQGCIAKRVVYHASPTERVLIYSSLGLLSCTCIVEGMVHFP